MEYELLRVLLAYEEYQKSVAMTVRMWNNDLIDFEDVPLVSLSIDGLMDYLKTKTK